MILPQVHLRKPCYDFYFLQAKFLDAILPSKAAETAKDSVHAPQKIAQSVVATGGVYKGQGRNQCELMTHTY